MAERQPDRKRGTVGFAFANIYKAGAFWTDHRACDWIIGLQLAEKKVIMVSG